MFSRMGIIMMVVLVILIAVPFIIKGSRSAAKDYAKALKDGEEEQRNDTRPDSATRETGPVQAGSRFRDGRRERPDPDAGGHD